MVPNAHPEEPAHSLQPGDLLAGRYRVTRLIGRGGMGEVYEAWDGLLNEAVAIKTLRGDLALDEGVARQFQKEIQRARKVTHTNVCRVFEAGVHEFPGGTRPPLRFFTMELLTGGETLASRIRRLNRLPRKEAFAIAVQMAEGLQAAHEAGIVHADFKSGNVILVPGPGGDRAVVTDFGVARIDPTMAPDETRTLSPAARLVGTVAYMSPEQMTGGTMTTASDIYSFGIVLFEMATGKLPFDSSHAIHGAVQRASEEGITARPLVPDIDPRWDSAIVRCLQNDPARRLSSAGELADCFRAGSRRTPRYWTPWEWIRAVAAALILLAAAGGYWIRSHSPYQPNAAALGWYGRGVDALHSMTYEAARRALEQAVAADPKFALAHASLARAYEEMDYSERAKDAMLHALAAAQETRISSADWRRLRSLQFVVSRDYELAAPLFQQFEAVAGERERPAAALESGWLAQQREKTDEAEAAYERAVKADPGYAAAKLRLGFILGRRRKLDPALKAFAEAEALYSASSDHEGVTETRLQRASLLNRSGRAAEAAPVIEKALASARAMGSTYQQIRAQLLQGVAARNLNDPQRAADLAREAIDMADARGMDNLASSGLIDLGNSFFARGDLVSGELDFRRALDLARRGRLARYQARAQSSLASICEQDGRSEEAKKLIEAVLPFYRQGGYRRELIQAMAALGSVYGQQAEFTEGIRVLREALPGAVQLQDSRIEGQVCERLGGNLRHQGAWPEAITEFERAVALLGPGVDSAYARLMCARLYYGLRRRQDAERSLLDVKRIIDRSPDPRLFFSLTLQQAEMAYEDHRITDTLALSQRALAAASKGGEGAEPKARLIEALLAIRNRHGNGSGLSVSVVEQLSKAGLILDAAAARLRISEASIAVGDRNSALKMAVEALAFYEPRGIWESVWRAHSVAARASRELAAVDAHRTAARAALAQLKASWPVGDVERYLERPEIKALIPDGSI